MSAVPEPPTLLLAVHAIVGSLSLLFGALALWAPRQRLWSVGYLWFTLAVATSALGLVALDPAGLWWLTALALLTGALVVIGHLAPRRGWGPRARAHGLGGAYVALVTATLVVSLEGFAQTVAWLVPTLIGVLLIELWVRRLRSTAGETSQRETAAMARPLNDPRRSQ